MEPTVKKSNHDSGVNFNNAHQFQAEQTTWERQQGVNMNPEGIWKDNNDNNLHEVDLKNDKSGGIGLSEKDNCHY